MKMLFKDLAGGWMNVFCCLCEPQTTEYPCWAAGTTGGVWRRTTQRDQTTHQSSSKTGRCHRLRGTTWNVTLRPCHAAKSPSRHTRAKQEVRKTWTWRWEDDRVLEPRRNTLKLYSLFPHSQRECVVLSPGCVFSLPPAEPATLNGRA